MYGCQQVLIHPDDEVKAVLEFICSEANKLANCGIYYCRQMLFKAYRYISKYELDSALKDNPHFIAMRSACAQQLGSPDIMGENVRMCYILVARSAPLH